MDILENIDWFIWEHVDTAKLYCYGVLIDIPDKIWNVVLNENNITLQLNVYNYSNDIYKSINITGPITIRKILDNIYNFYKQPIPKKEKVTSEDGYRNLYVPKTWLDTMGTNKIDPLPQENYRRHWATCQGRVRFEGITIITNNVYKVNYGS